jgi:hypothetical protein
LQIEFFAKGNIDIASFKSAIAYIGNSNCIRPAGWQVVEIKIPPVLVMVVKAEPVGS